MNLINTLSDYLDNEEVSDAAAAILSDVRRGVPLRTALAAELRLRGAHPSDAAAAAAELDD